ncbi:MAG: HAD family hydrolase, partial [Clostridia bacterium]|nr:HAD family hydrolase [Clostridia bacterium]
QSYHNNGARMLIRRALPPEKQNDEELIDRVLAEYIKNYSLCCTQSSRIYNGVHETLQKLRDMGVSMGIVTNKPDVQTQIMVPHYFGDLFGYKCGNSKEYPVKPDAARVFMALDALGKKAEDAFFVGDSNVDVQTARNAGIPAVGVAWGFGGRECFGNNTPDTIIEKAHELLNLVQHGF